jgi:hypothetical protein
MSRATVPASADESGGQQLPAAELRQVRAYAVMSGASGIVFAALFFVAFALLRKVPGLAVPDAVYTQFYNSGSDVLVALGLYVVPFAGIAFIWNMIATRTLISAYPDPPSTIPFGLHLASGVLLVAMMFAATAAVGAVALLTVFSVAPLPSVDIARALSSAGYGLAFVYGVRAAGMYMITTTTLMKGTGILPRWLAVIGYVVAAFLLVSTTFHPAILLVFPVWIIVTSVAVLVRAGRP